MTTLTNNTAATTTLFIATSSNGFTPVRGLRGVCVRIKCGAEGCAEMAFIFRNSEGKAINACTCGWRRWAPTPKKWGKPVTKTPYINEELEAKFAIKRAEAMANAQLKRDIQEFKPDMS